jgi:hypothetical protein
MRNAKPTNRKQHGNKSGFAFITEKQSAATLKSFANIT